MNMDARDLKQTTLKEFDTMQAAMPEDGLTYELIDGTVMMSPRPSISHQRISLNVSFYLKEKLNRCEPLQDTELQLEENLFVPDISVVCSDTKTTKQRIVSAPLMVVEILSQSSMSRDYIYKLNAYKRLGIKEYWIVDGVAKIIIVHHFGDEDETVSFSGDDILKSFVFPEVEIELNKIFV